MLFDDKNYKIVSGESFNEVDKGFVSFVNDLLNQESDKSILVIHGLILLSYLEIICYFIFDGMNFNIKYKDKIILDGDSERL